MGCQERKEVAFRVGLDVRVVYLKKKMQRKGTQEREKTAYLKYFQRSEK